ncbi:hypothetical protein A3Q56_04330 [Intoshia linei]|uniref:UBC core domain-containing protein n=1 Tax=Intoshia linei TaxID=1819745 RepID=A0A177B2Y2_9BILA|nr:hypothetical protein A3Q56_04330 [Intoshia linei]
MDEEIEWPREIKVIEELDESQKGEYKGISWGPDNIDKIDTCHWNAMIIIDKSHIYVFSIIMKTTYPKYPPEFYLTNTKTSVKGIKKSGLVDVDYYDSLKNWKSASCIKDVLLEIKCSLTKGHRKH